MPRLPLLISYLLWYFSWCLFFSRAFSGRRRPAPPVLAVEGVLEEVAAAGRGGGGRLDGCSRNLVRLRPWAALKSAWRRTTSPLCPNCDQQTVLTNFGFPWRGMFNRYPLFVQVCGNCRRSFRDESVKDVGGWMTTNLDAEVRPDFVMMWDRRVKWEPRA